MYISHPRNHSFTNSSTKIMDLDINSPSMHSLALCRFYHSCQTLGLTGLQRGCFKVLLMCLFLNGFPTCAGCIVGLCFRFERLSWWVHFEVQRSTFLSSFANRTLRIFSSTFPGTTSQKCCSSSFFPNDFLTLGIKSAPGPCPDFWPHVHYRCLGVCLIYEKLEDDSRD